MLRIDLLDNGGFQLQRDAATERLPWWREVGDGATVAEGSATTPPGCVLRQPVAGFAPLLDRARLTGRVEGRGSVRVTGGGGRFELVVEGEFEFSGLELRAAVGEGFRPRFGLELSSAGDSSARWSELSFEVALPDPTSAALAAELEGELAFALGPWIEHALDDVGPRRTAFLARDIDAVTGEPGTPRPTAHPYNLIFAEMLLPLAEAGGGGPWRAELERYLDDFLELGLHTDTGLPRLWAPISDRPLDDTPLEVAVCLRLLLDLAEAEPRFAPARCEAARAAALRMGETILARGVMPDGTVATTYRPSDGAPFFDVPPIRRLDVAAQLARLAALTGDERYRRAARDAALEVEYTLYWPGDWDSIDPGFDDTYGHLGERGVVMWRALPDEPVFQRIVLSGWERYAPLWRDALRLGGNVAADQVRCWRIAAELAELDPTHAAEVGELLDLALRTHFKGGQGDNGAWRDVTIVDFDPQHLPVGDTGGVPQNLLQGIATIARHPELGLATAETRARFAAVSRTTRATYGADHGLIGGARVREGANSAVGSIRYAVGVAAMLEALRRAP